MSDSRGSIFHRAVEAMIAGGSLDREEVGQLREAGDTYETILKRAETPPFSSALSCARYHHYCRVDRQYH
jgi:hypothetical protein